MMYLDTLMGLSPFACLLSVVIAICGTWGVFYLLTLPAKMARESERREQEAAQEARDHKWQQNVQRASKLAHLIRDPVRRIDARMAQARTQRIKYRGVVVSRVRGFCVYDMNTCGCAGRGEMYYLYDDAKEDPTGDLGRYSDHQIRRFAERLNELLHRDEAFIEGCYSDEGGS